MIHLFLPDLRSFVRNKKFAPEGNEHPVFYFEDENIIYFYKPIGSVIYSVNLMKEGLPESITISGLKQEFDAIQIPKRLDSPKIITGTIA